MRNVGEEEIVAERKRRGNVGPNQPVKKLSAAAQKKRKGQGAATTRKKRVQKRSAAARKWRGARLFDDKFFKYCCRHPVMAIMVVQTMLRMLFGDPYLMIASVTLDFLLVASSSSYRLDILARDADRALYAIELQRDKQGASFYRARDLACGVVFEIQLESSAVFRKRTGKKKAIRKFQEMRPVYEIFITESDMYPGHGPVVQFDMNGQFGGMPRSDDKVVRPVPEEGSMSVVFVNGDHKAKAQDNDKVGDLVHDLNCSKWEEIRTKELRIAVRCAKDPEWEEEGANLMKAYYDAELAKAYERTVEAEKKLDSAEKKLDSAEKRIGKVEKERDEARKEAGETDVAMVRLLDAFMKATGISAEQAVQSATDSQEMQTRLLGLL